MVSTVITGRTASNDSEWPETSRNAQKKTNVYFWGGHIKLLKMAWDIQKSRIKTDVKKKTTNKHQSCQEMHELHGENYIFVAVDGQIYWWMGKHPRVAGEHVPATKKNVITFQCKQQRSKSSDKRSGKKSVWIWRMQKGSSALRLMCWCQCEPRAKHPNGFNQNVRRH